MRTRGGVAVFAHPIRRDAWKRFEPEWAPLLSAIELWNRKSDGVSWGSEALELIRKTGLPAAVGQDFHRMRHFYPLTQSFEIEAGSTDPENLEAQLVAAIAGGRGRAEAFYRPLLDAQGSPASFPHRQLEKARRTVRDIVRRGKRR